MRNPRTLPCCYILPLCLVFIVVHRFTASSSTDLRDPIGRSRTRSSTSTTEPFPLDQARNFCAVLDGKSALQLWSDNLERVLKSINIRPDEVVGGEALGLAELLLQIVSPRLPQSTITVERDTEIIQRILSKGWRRYAWLTSRKRKLASALGSRSRPPPPPVQIYVVGGSVTAGHFCGSQRTSLACAWPHRLERMLNQILLGPENYSEGGDDDETNKQNKLVEVTSAGIGGTGTYVSSVLLESHLFSVKDYDILINAHATNDLWIEKLVDLDHDEKGQPLDPEENRETSGRDENDDLVRMSPLAKTIFNTVQRFARVALDPRDCRNLWYGKPLLVGMTTM